MDETDKVLRQLAEVVRPIVEAIEKSTPATKDHYDEYMAALTRIASKLSKAPSPSVYLGIGVALQMAGASKQGVQAALRAMGHL